MRSITELSSLQGRRALVTGAAGHIGFAAASTLAELGAQVAILDLDDQRCRDASARINAHRANSAIPIECDLRSEASTRDAVHRTIDQLDGLDIIVHSAAFVGTTGMPGWSVPFNRQTVESWDVGMRINLTSAFVIAQEGGEALSRNNHGSVILISSIYGLVGSDPAVYEGTAMNADRVLAYSASKGGLLQLMKHLATLLAPRVRVNAISPGGIERGQPEAFRKQYAARTPLKRMGCEEDLKGAIAYLASDLSAYVTGHNLIVDGGWTAW